MTTIAHRPIADDVPVDAAWQTGRRLYVRSRYGSALSEGLRAAGATWDRDERCWWIGSTRRQVALDLLAAYGADGAAEAARRAQLPDHAVAVPAGADAVRDAVRAAGGVWDPASRCWYLPTAEAARPLRQAAETARRAEAARRSAERAADAAAWQAGAAARGQLPPTDAQMAYLRRLRALPEQLDLVRTRDDASELIDYLRTGSTSGPLSARAAGASHGIRGEIYD